ncbi:xylulokinase [Zhongshania sp.]|uniref:xylulokinase n=1 Tax=Zhongshania sp. TaxID=1971902 RepID=UPI0035617B9C
MFLGIDLGTSGIKVIAINDAGEILAEHSSPLTVSNPKPLWSEQTPEDWWRALVTAMAGIQLKLGEQTNNIKAIGLSGQMHGATFLDAHGQVLRPCILWNDGRSGLECEELSLRLEDFQQRSGNLAMPGFTAPKVMWVAKHEPEVFTNTAKILLPKDYLAYRLTGLYRSDMSDAAGTLWLNPALRDWDDALLTASGLDRSYMPELLEGCEIAGILSNNAALALGLAQIPVVIGGGDNACGAIGVGVTEPGQAFLSLGTSGVLFAVSEGHRASPENTLHAFCHCLPERWHQMSVSLSAANSLAWFAGIVGQTIDALLRELDDSGISETDVSFLPYLSGERTPHNNPNASGLFFGLKNSTGRPQMTLAVLEGVAFSCADGYQAFSAAQTPIHDISLIGGGARSPRWRQMLSDVLQRPMIFRDGGEVGPALGAARLAQLSEHYHLPRIEFNQKIHEICPPPPVLEAHQPDESLQTYYADKLATYRQLYQQTKQLMN